MARRSRMERPAAIVERDRLAQQIELEILTNVQKCIGNLMVLANGVEVERARPEGGKRVFTLPPDRMANEYILNRILGRPSTRKPVEAPTAAAPRADLSRVPQDRLETMERWLAEANGETTDPQPPGNENGA